jgi:hypothetical protein
VPVLCRSQRSEFVIPRARLKTSRSGNVLIEPTQLAADTSRMANKPELPTWDIYKIAAILLGTVEAPDKQAAVEKAAQEFKTEVWRLYAVERR